jgi:glutathione peroxidase-family protein
MKKLIVASVACGLLLSAATMVGQQAMQDAKDANKYGGAKFDGSKVKVQNEQKVNNQKAQPNYKALNQAENNRAKVQSQQLHLDKPAKAIPSPAPQKKKP